MSKQPKDELPLLDEFTEDSLLDTLEEEEQEDAAAKGGSEEDDDEPNPEKDEDGKKPKSGKKKPEPEEEEEEDEEDEEDEEEEEEEDDEPEDTFWADVERLTGRKIEVDYGDVDPESPEGAAIREEALIQQAIAEHLDYLSKAYPREFKALEHAANGGKLEDLFNPAEPDYSKIEIPQDDEEFQRSFLKSYYERKGFSSAKAVKMVELDEDSDEGLYKAATEALQELAEKQEQERSKILEEQRKAAEMQKKQDMQMVQTVESIISSGKLNKFTVPVKEREDFYKYALTHIQRNPQGGYMIVQPVDPKELEMQLQEMYFAYKKGDLGAIIQREVKSESARRLKRAASKATKKKGSDTGESRHKDRKGLPTLDDYTV